MKVALLTDSRVFAGTERHILDLAIGLRGEGAMPIIACPAQGVLARRASTENIPVIPIEKGALRDMQAVGILASALRIGRVDVIHAHNGRTALIGAMAKSIARRGVLVASQHFLDPARTGRRGVLGAMSRSSHRWVSSRTDRTIAISQAVCDNLLKRGDGTMDGIRVVLNGICDPLAHVLRSKECVRESFDIPLGAPLIVCVARLEKEKNVQDLLEAMNSVLLARPDARCIVAGEGSDRKSLEQQIAQAGIGHSVTLAGFQSEPLSLMKAADVFVLPSAAEPFGLVLLEAMALGVPVVATRAGGPMEIVAHPETGLLVRPNAPQEIAAALLQCIQNHSLVKAMGKAGRESFLERFTVRHMAAQMLAAYRECMPPPVEEVVLSDKNRQPAGLVG